MLRIPTFLLLAVLISVGCNADPDAELIGPNSVDGRLTHHSIPIEGTPPATMSDEVYVVVHRIGDDEDTRCKYGPVRQQRYLISWDRKNRLWVIEFDSDEPDEDGGRTPSKFAVLYIDVENTPHTITDQQQIPWEDCPPKLVKWRTHVSM